MKNDWVLSKCHPEQSPVFWDGAKDLLLKRKNRSFGKKHLRMTAVVFFIFLGMSETLALPSAHAMGRKPKEFTVELKVDFGPAGKPGFEDKKFLVEKGTTPKEAVSQVFPVLSGRGCCSLREVIGIDGVEIDPLKNRWWVSELNGSRKFSPQKKELEPGDKVEWKYIQNKQ